jgi:hypothetical protein
MEKDCLSEFESLRKRDHRDEDGDIEKMIRNMCGPKKRLMQFPKIKTDPKTVTMSELLDDAHFRQSTDIGGDKGLTKFDRKKMESKENKLCNGNESDCRSSTASKNGEPTTTAFVTSHSFKSRGFSQKWKEKDTRLFFKALSLFGTDFSMIALLFKGRDRSQLINKYHKEERDNPSRVEEALRVHRQGSSRVLRRCNQILDQPRREGPIPTRLVRFGSASSLDSLDQMIYCELDDQINKALDSSSSIPGSSVQP